MILMKAGGMLKILLRLLVPKLCRAAMSYFQIMKKIWWEMLDLERSCVKYSLQPFLGRTATIKAHVRSFVNEGNDVQTPKDLETAMLSSEGLSGIRVALFDSLGIKDGPFTWDGISLINNLQHTGLRITVRRSYDIGIGKIINTAVEVKNEWSL